MAKLSKQSRQAGPGKPGVQRASVLIVTVVLALGILTAAVFLRAGELDSKGSPRPSLVFRWFRLPSWLPWTPYSGTWSMLATKSR